MTFYEFVRQNRAEIDSVIRSNGGSKFNDAERRMWVLNDEELYLWAKREGVKSL